jgi:hypothetical protein
LSFFGNLILNQAGHLRFSFRLSSLAYRDYQFLSIPPLVRVLSRKVVEMKKGATPLVKSARHLNEYRPGSSPKASSAPAREKTQADEVKKAITLTSERNQDKNEKQDAYAS